MEQASGLKQEFKVAEIELSYKNKGSVAQRPKIENTKGAYAILRANWNENILELQEQFKVVLLNKAHKVLGIYTTSTGGIAGTVVDPKLIFTAALKTAASAIIISHNHPSGNLQPSKADELITQKIKAGAALLDLTLLDHIIVTYDAYFSFADEGLL